VNRIEWNENIMSGLGGLLGKNLSYPSEMSKEMSILAFARGSFKTLFSKHQKMGFVTIMLTKLIF